LEELSAIARGLGQLDAEGGLASMLESLVAASREFIGIADLEGNALFVNEAGRKLVGLRDLEAVHSTQIIDYFIADDHDRSAHYDGDTGRPAKRVRDTGFWEGELRFRHFGELGRCCTGPVSAVPFRSRQNLLQNFAVDAIVTKNLDGIIANWNRGAERIFGYTAEEARRA
jgi:PAS domain-containing protein